MNVPHGTAIDFGEVNDVGAMALALTLARQNALGLQALHRGERHLRALGRQRELGGPVQMKKVALLAREPLMLEMGHGPQRFQGVVAVLCQKRYCDTPLLVAQARPIQAEQGLAHGRIVLGGRSGRSNEASVHVVRLLNRQPRAEAIGEYPRDTNLHEWKFVFC